MNWQEFDKKYKGKHREFLLKELYRLENEMPALKREKSYLESKLITIQERLNTPEYQILRTFEKIYKNKSGLLCSCIRCQRLRNRKGDWHNVSQFLRLFTSLGITSGICPHCHETVVTEWKNPKKNEVD